MAGQIPLVDYLVLGDRPHLVANQCTACGARFFDRRNALYFEANALGGRTDAQTLNERQYLPDWNPVWKP